MKPVLFDFETCSGCDLRSVGGRNYAAHESTRVLIGVFLIDGTFHVWVPGQDITLPCFADVWPKQLGAARPVALWSGSPFIPSSVCDAVEQGREFIAHNCHEFDEWIWREKLDPVPHRFGDTIHACRAAGLPGALNELGRRFFGTGKDAGQLIMSRMWKLDFVDGAWVNKHQTPGNIAAAARYCIGDVVILEKVYAETFGLAESNVLGVHRAINRRGVRLDTETARALIEHSNHVAESAKNEIERITGGELKAQDVGNPAKVKAWLCKHGLPLDSLRKPVVEALLKDPDGFMEALLEELEDSAG